MRSGATEQDQDRGSSRARLPQRLAKSIRAQADAILKWRPDKKDGAEILLIASTLPLYYLVRGLAHQRIDEAIDRGVAIINLEKSLGIFWEVQLQSWALSSDGLITFLNWFYLYGHLPVIGVLALWLYFWHKPQYLFMRNAFLLSGAIGLIIYVNFPTAPPRLLPEYMGFGFVDTIYEQYNTGRPGTPAFFVNEYAALPSLHFGWNLLVGIAIWLATKNIFMRAFGVAMPILMLVTIVLTGNHYFLDAAAGFAIMCIGIGIAVGGKMMAKRIVSPSSKKAREQGWVSWFHWLFGVPDHERKRADSGMQAA